MKANIITRNHDFENKLNWVKQNKKTIEMRHEKDTQSTYVYRTPEIDYAFKYQDWGFFERLEMAVIDEVDTSDRRSRIYYRINTAGWLKKYEVTVYESPTQTSSFILFAKNLTTAQAFAVDETCERGYDACGDLINCVEIK